MSKKTEKDEAGTDLALADDAAALAALEDLESDLAAQNAAEIDKADITIPILKLAQPLTDEVSTGDASPGDFVISLTRDSVGKEIGFIVAGKEKGRFRPGDKKEGTRTLVAYGEKIVPWEDDPFYGQPFTEHPEAEERWRVDHADDWGSGPPIQTTYNFTGYIVEKDDDGNEVINPVPVRLSLRRTTAPAARKWITILDAVLRGRYWDAVFNLASEQEKGDKGNYYSINIKRGRATEPTERLEAVKLAKVLREQSVAVVGDEDGGGAERGQSEPAANGGLDVG